MYPNTITTPWNIKIDNGRLQMVGTTATPTWNSPGAITWSENTDESQPVSLVYTSYDSYRKPAGLLLIGSQGSEWFEVRGNIYSNGFVKATSSDSYVLLGGGGHKTISSLSVAYADEAGVVTGSYTANGGQQKPNYFGKNKVGFLMMNTTVNNNSQYKDWIIMDCYAANDVGGGVAFGVNRQSLGAYIMRSKSERATWEESAELIGTHNYTTYTVKKDGTGASGTWNISAKALARSNGNTTADSAKNDALCGTYS